MKNKQDKGFTLVELLIVIVILGILATVTVFAVRGITARSQTNACQVERRALETAVEAFFVDSGTQTFPTTLGALVPNFIKADPNPAAPAVQTWIYVPLTGAVSANTATGAKCAPAP